VIEQLIEVLRDMHKVVTVMDEDSRDEEGLDVMEQVTAKYKDVSQKLVELEQFRNKYHKITQVTDRASMRAGGVEKYEHIQFLNDKKIYFGPSNRNTIA
jgi:hypothetical protein